jgi:hypothetical protein
MDALETLLGTATRVVDEMRREGLLQRLVAVLGNMVAEDREVLVRVLEHDAGTHARVPQENVWSRFIVRPNPFAQLFTRATAGGRTPSVRHLEIRRATHVGVRMARSLPPWTQGGWEAETIATWLRMSPDRRAYVADMSRRALGVLEQNRRRAPHV